MRKIPKEVLEFFDQHHVVVVSTLDSKGRIHASVKGIVGIEEKGKFYIIDLYRKNTFSNLQKNPVISLTAVNEKKFTGFSIKGKAFIVGKEEIEDSLIRKWEDKIIKRISKRLIGNVKKYKSQSIHPEAELPSPQYLIVVEVEDIVDLAPSDPRK